jgi:LysR family transcriptional regulator, benzoate and cis,cis-muconate-responsive activator of ben and cat genes
MMMIQIQRLEGFYWVARCRGYARAARSFPYPISQPGVHQQVSKLERELGARLFERVGKDEVRLTAAGEKLYGFCAPFLEQLPGVVEAIQSASFGGELRIDASGLVLRQLLPAWIRRLRSRRSDIQVDVQEIQTPELERLRKGEAHLLVDYFDSVPPEFEKTRVATSYAFLILPKHAEASAKDLRALKNEPFVSYHPELRQHAVQLEAVRRSIGVPARTISASSVDSILAFVQAGLGFSVVPWLEPRGPKLPGVVARRQSGPGTEFPIWAVCWRTEPAHPLVQAALGEAPVTSG